MIAHFKGLASSSNNKSPYSLKRYEIPSSQLFHFDGPKIWLFICSSVQSLLWSNSKRLSPSFIKI